MSHLRTQGSYGADLATLSKRSLFLHHIQEVLDATVIAGGHGVLFAVSPERGAEIERQ